MKPEDIDDLFRQQLDGHATPPSDDLWARLSLPAAPAAEPLDELFRAGLAAHITPPRRELWERLEDEHLRPQPRWRRVAAWWQYSAAAVLLLMLLAGGAGLWRGGYFAAAPSGLATTKPPQPTRPSDPTTPASKGELPAPATEAAAPLTARPGEQVAATISRASKKNQQIFSAQATAPRASTSSTPMATTTQPRRAASAGRAAGSHHQQLDAAAGQLTTTGQPRPASQPPTTPRATDNPPATPIPAPLLAMTTSATAAPEIIEVEVRRGATPASATPTVVVAVAEAAPTPTRRPRLRLGGLLRQADHLVHGESVNLAEATGLPETVTLHARLGGRLVSKTIQL